jgi:hypothetical protein
VCRPPCAPKLPDFAARRTLLALALALAALTAGCFVGAAAFLFGPWFDANAMTGADSASPTTWGTAVRDQLF